MLSNATNATSGYASLSVGLVELQLPNLFSQFSGAGLVGEPVQMVTAYDAVWHGTQLCVFSVHF